MKFGEQLDAHIFPEWQQYYVQYRRIKDHIEILFPGTSNNNHTSANNNSIIHEQYHKFKHSVSKQFDSLRTQIDHRFNVSTSDQHESLLHSTATNNNNHIQYNTINRDNDTKSVVSTSEGADAFSSASDTDVDTDNELHSSSSTNHKNNRNGITTTRTGKYRYNHKISDAAQYSGMDQDDIDRRVDEILVKIMYELNKINSFYCLMEDELVLAYSALKTQVDHIIKPITIRTTPKRHRSKQIKQFNNDINQSPSIHNLNTTSGAAASNNDTNTTSNVPHAEILHSDNDDGIDKQTIGVDERAARHRDTTKHNNLYMTRTTSDSSDINQHDNHSNDDNTPMTLHIDILEDHHVYLRNQFIELLRKQTMLIHYVDCIKYGCIDGFID